MAASSYFSDLQTQKQEPNQFVPADLFQTESFEHPPTQPEVQLGEEQVQQQQEHQQQLEQQEHQQQLQQPTDETIAWYQSELVK